MSCNFQIKFRILVQLIVLSELAIEGVGSRTNLESRRDNIVKTCFKSNYTAVKTVQSNQRLILLIYTVSRQSLRRRRQSTA